jgi:hypothetical protein
MRSKLEFEQAAQEWLGLPKPQLDQLCRDVLIAAECDKIRNVQGWLLSGRRGLRLRGRIYIPFAGRVWILQQTIEVVYKFCIPRWGQIL